MKRALFVFFLLIFRIVIAADTRPELVLQSGHTGAVLCVAMSPDGKWLASGGNDSTIKIWDLKSGRLLRTLYGHNAKILAIAISPNGHYVLSSADDGTARLWDVYGAQQVRELNGAESSITSVAFAKGGEQTLTASIHSIQIWDTASGQQIRSIAIPEKDQGGRVLLSADGRMYTTGGASQSPGSGLVPFAGSKDPFRPLKVIDVASGKELMNLKTDTQNPYATYIFSPDGRFLARRSSDFEKSQNVESVEVYDVSSGKQFASLRIPGEGTAQATGALAMSNDGKWLAAAGSLGNSMTQSIIIFDLASKQQVRELQTSGMFAPSVNLDVVSVVTNPFAFSPDAKTLAYGGSTSIQLWDVSSGQPIARLRTNLKAGAATGSVFDEQMEEQAKKYGYTLEQAAEMKEEASGMMESMSDPDNPLSQIMNMGAKMAGMKGADARTYSDKRIQFSPNGKWLISENRDEIRIWDIGTGVLQQQRTYMRVPIAFSHDGRLLALMEFDPTKTDPQETIENRSQDLVVRDLNTWTVISRTTFTGKTQPEELVFAPDGSWLAAKFADEVRVLDPKDGHILRSISVGEGFSDKSVFDASGKYFAMGGKESTGNFMDQISSMAMSMQGVDMKDKKKARKQMEEMQKQMSKMMGGGQMQSPQQTQYKIKIFDLQNGNQIQTIALESRPQESVQIGGAIAPGTDTETHRIIMSPDGDLLALETTEQDFPVVRIYSTATGSLRTTIRVSSRPIQNAQPTTANPLAGMFKKQFHPAFSFSPDGKKIAITSQESGYAVKLYDTASGNLIATLPQNNRVDAIAFHPGGRFLVSYVRDGTRTIWDLSNNSVRATLMEFSGLYFATEWLVATPDGLFDGSPAAWGQIQWRLSPNLFDLSPVETFFNEFYYPGLLQEIFNAKAPAAPRDLAAVDRRQPEVQVNGEGNGQSREIKIKIQVQESPADSMHSSGSGVKDVRLFRNGTLVKVWRGDVLHTQSSAVLETSVPIVAGDNRFVAYAFNHDNVKSVDSMWRVEGAENLKRKGTAYILSIGVNQYENQDFNLKYAVADAQAFVENLTAAQTKLAQFEKVQPVTLIDQDATKANILATLQALSQGGDASKNIQPAQPEDAIFIYFAGHGTAEKGHFYMVPHDLGYTGSRDSLSDAGYREVLKHSISDEELQQTLENIGAAQTVLIIDACNSGQALESEEKRRGPINAKGLAQLAYEKGMYVLAAAQGYQAALEATKLGHGYLTYVLVEEGIKTADADQEPKDGQVVVREWLNYAAGRVPEMQSEKMQEARLLKHEVAFVDGEEKIDDLQKRSVQQPRIYYRREMDFNPLIILKP